MGKLIFLAGLAASLFLGVLAGAQDLNHKLNHIPWWKKNNLRVIQTNLPAYEAATLDPDSLVQDLITYSANTLIINAGGIMAFYPSKLDFHYINPYMKSDMLGRVVEKCHQHQIKVIVRFDFSRLDKTIYEAHPDWVYVDKNGQHMINTDKYVTGINAPYVQQKAFDIMAEVMDLYPIDGIFLNMPGYQVNNAYEGKYHGIDQNEHDKKRFSEYSGGLTLPVEENRADPVYLKYLAFKKMTTDEWQYKLHQLVKSKNPNIAICTYSAEHVDIIRHESQTNSLPYFPYNASDNVNSMITSYPEHIVSNASIQQISFQSRYNAIEPEEIEIRLWENIANGSGLDLSLMGDMRDYEDERNYGVIKKVYGHHKRNEKYYGRYKSVSKIAVVAPGWWPSGPTMQEFRGIQLMLKEAHIPFDIIEDSQIGVRSEGLKKYKLIILPDIYTLNTSSIQVLDSLAMNGVSLLATNSSLKDQPGLLTKWFGVKSGQFLADCSGQYLGISDYKQYPSLAGQKMIFLKFNLMEYDMSGCDLTALPLLAKGRPGPPEMIGGHDPTGNYGLGLKKYGSSWNAILPVNLGKLYYLHGYEQHKNIVLDLIHQLLPSDRDLIQTSAHPRVETILQEFDFNEPNTYSRPFKSRGLILHLVNLTGFSGNTYFTPLPGYQIKFSILSAFKPSRVWGINKNTLAFIYKSGRVEFTLPKLESYEAVVMER
ncbi:MAG: alpha-amylase family protein [Saprospiraceae bacterium]|nr:alpha-amylase family protein [Saprospiraceae bacterium]